MIDTTIPAKFIESYQTHDDALNDREGDLYNDSPFRVYKEMSSKRKGKFFEKLITLKPSSFNCSVLSLSKACLSLCQ